MTKDTMKQQVDVSVKLSLWLDATKSQRGIAAHVRKALRGAFGEELVAAEFLDVREEAAIYSEKAKGHLVKTTERLKAALAECARLLADYDEAEGEEGEAYREAIAALAQMPRPFPRRVPPDPERMNDKRSAWASAAVRAFIDETGTDEEDAVCDLVADLMHWCDRHGYEFDVELGRGRSHYDAETGSEDSIN